MTTQLKAEFDKLVAQQNELAKQFQTTAQALFKETTKNFFTQCPQVKAFKWQQYTPYFNDGEPCTFRVGEVTFTNAEGEDLEEVRYGEYQGETEGIWCLEGWYLESSGESARQQRELTGLSQEQINVCSELNQLIQSGDFESVLLAMFGDHVEITATLDGFSVDSYDHD